MLFYAFDVVKDISSHYFCIVMRINYVLMYLKYKNVFIFKFLFIIMIIITNSSLIRNQEFSQPNKSEQGRNI